MSSSRRSSRLSSSAPAIDSSPQSKSTDVISEQVSAKKAKRDDKSLSPPDAGTPLVGLSDYELTRLENIRRNESFLQNLGLDAAREAAFPPIAIKPTKRGATKKIRLQAELPSRRSGRVTVEKLKAEVQELEESGNLDSEVLRQKKAELEEMLSKRYDSAYAAAESNSRTDDGKNIVDKAPVSLNNWLNKDEGPESSSSSLFSQIAKYEVVDGVTTSDFKKYHAALNKLSVKEMDVAKLCPSRITSVFVHPSREKLLVFAGDKNGFVGLWDVDDVHGDSAGVLTYQTHNSNVTRLHCSSHEPSKIYSSSYDGTIRCLDTSANAFVLAFDSPGQIDDHYFTSDCFFASNAYGNGCCAFVGKSDGTVSFADLRASSTAFQWDLALQEARINSVQEHPTNSHLLVTAGTGKAGCIRVHDTRAMRQKKESRKGGALVEINEHSKTVNAAYVSGDGDFMVSVSLDNTVRTWSNFIDPNSRPLSEVICFT